MSFYFYASQLFIILLLCFQYYCIHAQQTCRLREYQLVSVNQVVNITSTNYPAAYAPGSSCRYKVVAPMDHVVVLSCRFEVYPDACSSEYLYISLDGDLQFRDGESYCSSRQLTRISNFRSIAFSYYSRTGATNLRARFHCQAYARRQACGCGWSTATKITNGQEATRHEYPAMVALRDITSSQRIFCGGSIVSHRHILTAAHCIGTQPDARRIMAYVGVHDLMNINSSPYAAQHRIQQIIKHPGYTATDTNVANDVAFLITSAPIEWSRGVGPICLPLRQINEPFSYVNVDVIGWGTLSFAASKSNTLQKVSLLTMDNQICASQYNASLTATQICTYDYRGLGQDSCQYDSGGPLVYRQQRMFLLGIISFGRTCGTRYAIGVNTRITAHLNWIWRYVSGGVCVM